MSGRDKTGTVSNFSEEKTAPMRYGIAVAAGCAIVLSLPMYQPIRVSDLAPHSVTVFVSEVCDLYLSDVHAMLRLPRHEVGITQACNLAAAAVLLNCISGVSTVLFNPPPDRTQTGTKFKNLIEQFYPWDMEPVTGIRDEKKGARVLYETFRNPIAHAFGFQHPEPDSRIELTRFPGEGFSEDALEAFERTPGRPNRALRGAPTLSEGQGGSVSLNIEALYWGVRALIRRVTMDEERMTAAAEHLDPMLLKHKV